MGSKYWSKNNIGKTINYFTIIGMKEHGGLRGRKVYVCKCCCNKIVEKEPYMLFGSSPHKSCGCMTNKLKNKTHGLRNTRLFNIWSKMRQRCNNEKDKLYKYYGKRGIRVCEEWNNFVIFYKWAMSNEYKDTLTLERLNVNGNYEPSNCAWRTMKVQCNNKRNNIKITYKGKTQTLKQWCEELGIDYKLTHNRIKYRKWSIEKAFNTPSGGCESKQIFTYKNKTQNLSKWCKEYQQSLKLVNRRIHEFGWDFERALLTPSKGKGSRR